MNLEQIAPILEDIIRQSLYEKRYPFGFSKNRGVGNKVASGTLARSVQVDVGKRKSSHGNYETYYFQILMEQYYQWVQSGRRPGNKYVPIGSLMKWIKDRGLKGRNKKGKFITDKSFAFAISRNINKFGIRPSNFLDVSLEKVMKDPRIAELMGDATYEDLINIIEGI